MEARFARILLDSLAAWLERQAFLRIQNMEDTKGWIFISHSTKDLETVRRVRDYLETKNHHPLLFFLKCIRDTDELDSLIKREIEARSIFLLCDSPNARAANWVQKEIQFIQSMRDRHFQVVDLTAPWRVQQSLLDHISQRGTLFLSYSGEDAQEVSGIYEALRAYDYSIFFDRSSLQAGDDWRHANDNEIKEALSKGAFIYFANAGAASRQVSHQFAELHRALSTEMRLAPRNHRIIFVVLGSTADERELPWPLSEYRYLDLRGLRSIEQARRIHHLLCNDSDIPEGNV